MSLADAVLSAEDIENELNADTEELSLELKKLRELREAAARDFRPSSRATRLAEVSDVPSLVPDPPEATTSRQEAPPPVVAGSLADQILASGDGDDVEREFEAMEQELQQQLLKYKEQCQGVESPAAARALAALSKDPLRQQAAAVSSGQDAAAASSGQDAAAATLGQDASTTAGSGSWPSRPSSEASAKRVTSSAAEDDVQGDVNTPELLRLRAEASQLEDAFPDSAEAGSKAAELPARIRSRRIKNAAREAIREEAPDDPETADLREVLGKLDVRVSAIQQRHAMHESLERESNVSSNNAAAAKAINEMRAQNAHLRERFKAADKRGLLGIDASIFGASEPRPKA